MQFNGQLPNEYPGLWQHRPRHSLGGKANFFSGQTISKLQDLDDGCLAQFHFELPALRQFEKSLLD